MEEPRELSATEIESLRCDLEALTRELTAQLEANADAARPVKLDQTAVGRISRVTEDAAWVRPIVARGCEVSARVDRSRTLGILDWSSRWGVHLTFVPFRADISAGDVVTSTGLGGVFPGGIRIGEVTRTEPVPSQGTLRVFVTPAVNFSSLEEVFVVLEATGSPQPDPSVPGPPPLGG